MGDLDAQPVHVGYMTEDGWQVLGRVDESTITSSEGDKPFFLGDMLEELSGSFEFKLPWWYYNSAGYKWLMLASGAIGSCYCRRTAHYTIRRMRHGSKSHKGKAPKWKR